MFCSFPFFDERKKKSEKKRERSEKKSTSTELLPSLRLSVILSLSLSLPGVYKIKNDGNTAERTTQRLL